MYPPTIGIKKNELRSTNEDNTVAHEGSNRMFTKSVNTTLIRFLPTIGWSVVAPVGPTTLYVRRWCYSFRPSKNLNAFASLTAETIMTVIAQFNLFIFLI